MPTARELLQQADALMRRNRAPIGDDDIPELTDVVPESALEHPAAPTVLEDVPEIAGTIDELRSAPSSETIAPEDEPSVWLDEPAMGVASITGELPDSVLAVAPAMPAPEPDAHAPERDARALESEAQVPEPDAQVPEPDAQVPEPDAQVLEPDSQAPEQGVLSPVAAPLVVPEAVADLAADVRIPLAWDDIDAALKGDAIAGPAPQAHPGPAYDSVVPSRGYGEDMARWEALAEEIRMQVLQRIDIFTDAGLKEQLNERLQPVVDRASAELVGTISLHVGQLLRAYVAEAIEREIDKWRQGGS